MPRSAAQIDDAVARVERWLDELDPATAAVKDAAPLRRVHRALKAVAEADHELADAVAAARAAGHSWTAIGISLGVSRQAAQQRYGPRSA